MPTLQEMLEGRKNHSAYSFFIFFFCRRAIGTFMFRQKYKVNYNVASVVTRSDEAYILCYLEGTWDELKKAAEKEKENPTRNLRNKRARYNRERATGGTDGQQQMPKQLVVRCSYSCGRGKSRDAPYGGWKPAGIHRYNAVFDELEKQHCEAQILTDFDSFFKDYAYTMSRGEFGVKKNTEPAISESDADGDASASSTNESEAPAPVRARRVWQV